MVETPTLLCKDLGMVEHLPEFGVVLGAASLLAGYVFHRFSKTPSKELPYPEKVPQFTDMQKLREYLEDCPNLQADVLIEGVVKRQNDSLGSRNKTVVEGAAIIVTTTEYKKVYDTANKKWNNNVSSSIENRSDSVKFQLSDENGKTVIVQPIHKAGGFRHILEKVWEYRVGEDSRSLGDYTMLKEIPNGSLTREFFLTFGTTLGAYGIATLKKSGINSPMDISFFPSEVGSSIQGVTATRELTVSILSYMSLLFVVGGGGLLVFSTVSLVMRALGYQVVRPSEQRRGDNDYPAPGVR